ncbi:MAG: thioredoxin family protein [Flavobacteriaceae bacterium]|nr:thioredoxin family protein [Flavobacteriaceae bacterium]
MAFNTVSTEAEFESAKAQNLGVLFYFSTISCSVGEALEPKVMALLEKEFPKIPFYFVDMNASPEVSANNQVFVEPTILVFFDGKETIRKSRIVSIDDLSQAIERIYKLAFE